MFATKCSFCQHDNLPGARFCADCGSPLHLKVCPACGKVSDVTATLCEHCNTHFPKIEIAPPAASAPPPAPPAPPTTSATKASGAGINAMPLIIVAIVAGGLPLLWVNRAHLPMPKTWQPNPPAAIMPAPAAAPAPVIAAPIAKSKPTPPAPPSTPAPENIALPPLQVSPPPAESATPPEPATTITPEAASAAKEAEARQAARAKREANAKKARQAAATAEPQPARPCTEAVAALGLCDPKQAAKK